MTYHGSDERGRPLYKVPEYLVALCRQLRASGTKPEAILWACLRNRQLGGAKLRRQHVIGRYVADFHCHEHRLVVELDGGIHDAEEQGEYDVLRGEELAREGFRVVRLRNQAVLQRAEVALRLILAALGGDQRSHA